MLERLRSCADDARTAASRFAVPLELLLILLVGWRFVIPFTNFDDNFAPAGREFEGNAGWIWLGIDALRDGRLPLWNPYFGTGLPYLADPLSHLFSPLALFPALFLGADDGPRLAVPLTIISAGLAQYYLGHVVGLSSPARVLGALVYMMNGQMLVRFEFGHYDFGLAYPYLPLTVALLIKCLTTDRGVLYPILGGASLAGLLFAGNLYYFAFFLPALVIVTFFYTIDVAPSGRPMIRLHAVYRAAALAVFAAGFSAIQWMPWYAMAGDVVKPGDRLLRGSPTVEGSLRLLFTGDISYADGGADGRVPGFELEYYAYIGALLIPLFIVSPLALFFRSVRVYLLCVVLLWFYVLWASAAHTPFKYVYEHYERLYDFRWTVRQLALGLPFAALIASLGFDALWRGRAWLRGRVPQRRRQLASALIAVLSAVLVLYGAWSLWDQYDINRERYHFLDRRQVPAPKQFAEFLARDRDRPYFFDQSWVGLSGVRWPYQDLEMVKHSRAVWGWERASAQGKVLPEFGEIELVPIPRYLSQPAGEPAPPRAQRVAEFEGVDIYRPQDETPYAGFVNRASARQRPQAFDVGDRSAAGFVAWPWIDIEDAEASWPDTNQVEVRGAPGEGHDLLVVLESYDEHWRLEIDGERAPKPENVGGLIGIPAREGVHTYLLVYDPDYAARGVAVTIGTIVAAAMLLLYAPARRLARRALGRQ
jgi:hypothetical protein